MIHITEGLQLNEKTVSHISLKELMALIDQHGIASISLRDAQMGSHTLKSLPIHINSEDLPYLEKLSILTPILTPAVTFKCNTTVPQHYIDKIHSFGCNVIPAQISHKFPAQKSHKTAMIVISCVAFAAFIGASFFILKKPKEFEKWQNKKKAQAYSA